MKNILLEINNKTEFHSKEETKKMFSYKEKISLGTQKVELKNMIEAWQQTFIFAKFIAALRKPSLRERLT